MRAGDIVKITTTTHPTAAEPSILYNAQNLLVVDKPPGILSNGPDSLEDLLQKKLARPGLKALHRLDRDTSGCLMFTDNAALRDAVIQLFAAQQVTKVYNAIVGVRPNFQTKSCTLPVDGLSACTNLRVLDAGPQCAHMQISITTGRTHQIGAIWKPCVPLLGERVCFGRRLTEREMCVPRQMLHAAVALPLPGADAPLQMKRATLKFPQHPIPSIYAKQHHPSICRSNNASVAS